MNELKMIELANLCTLNMGQSPDSSTYNEQGNGLPFFQGNADFGEIHPKVRVWCSDPIKIANIGDILISVRAPIGAMNIADERCCIGRGLAALTPNQDVCLQQYLYYAIQSRVDSLISQGTGSTFKAISKKVLEQTLIPVYSIDEQNEIISKIKEIETVIKCRVEQQKLLDDLIKSRFLGEVAA
ncbi:MAG: restriction endonuclease subunit S [Clostridia bacterium]|nr:restriction endonuclease subunit S [Clostridia bacterium]